MGFVFDGVAFADPSRYCSCQATLHKMICNCMGCGKICCEMEVGSTCTFCGATLPIAAGMGKKAVANARRRAQQQSSEHMEQFGLPSDVAHDESLQRAIAHKDKLLHFQSTSQQRTHVYDDQADYYTDTASMWLSEAERKVAQAAERQRREERATLAKPKMSFDISGRMVVVKVDSASTGVVTSKFGRQIGKTTATTAEAEPTPAVIAATGPEAAFPALPSQPRVPRGKAPVSESEESKRLRSEGLFLGAGAGAPSSSSCAVDAPYSNPTLTGRAGEVYAAMQRESAWHRTADATAIRVPLALRVQHDLSFNANPE